MVEYYKRKTTHDNLSEKSMLMAINILLSDQSSSQIRSRFSIPTQQESMLGLIEYKSVKKN